MPDRCRAGRERARRRPWRFNGEQPGARIAGGHGYDHVGLVEVVHGHRQQVLNTAGTAAQAHVGNVETVLVGGFERVHDVLGARALERAGKYVVIAEQSARRDTGHVVGGDAIHSRRGAEIASHGAGDVGAMLLDCHRRETQLGCSVAEHLGRDYLVVRQAGGAELRLRRIAGIAEAGVGDVDAGVEDRDLDAITSAVVAPHRPSQRRADQRQIGVGRVRIVQALVLRVLDHRRRRHLRQRRAIQLHRHRVQRDVELAGDFRPGYVRAQPGFVIVAQRGQLRPVGLDGVIAEFDFLTLGRLGLDVGGERIAVELDQRGTGVLGRPGRDVGVAVSGAGGLHRCHRQREHASKREGEGDRSQAAGDEDRLHGRHSFQKWRLRSCGAEAQVGRL